jgi:hypothetical protein
MAGPRDLKPEVRRCRRCQQPTLFRVSGWTREFAGLELGEYATDWRCESCGHGLTLQSWKQIKVQRVFGYVFLVALFPGAWFLLRTWAQAHRDNPVIDDAPLPATVLTLFALGSLVARILAARRNPEVGRS